MNKCEYMNGRLIGCDKAEEIFNEGLTFTECINRGKYFDPPFRFCPYCGSEITSHLIIKKSGDTWIARYKEEHYIYTEHATLITNDDFFNNSSKWISFRSATLDDNFAKLRPMVVWDSTTYHSPQLVKLYGVVEDDDYGVICYDLNDQGIDGYRLEEVRLATVEDL